MSKISELNESINNANIEISSLEQLIQILNNISTNIVSCVPIINEVSTKLSIGLIVGGKSADDGKLNERAKILSNYNTTIEICINAVDTRIGILNDNITIWENERNVLEKEAEKNRMKNTQIMTNTVFTFQSVNSKNNIK